VIPAYYLVFFAHNTDLIIILYYKILRCKSVTGAILNRMRRFFVSFGKNFTSDPEAL
jgi:hypothetical protein